MVMKRFVKKIMYGIAWLISLIFNNIFFRCGREFVCLINTANFRRKLGKKGKNTHIGRNNYFENLGNVCIGNNFCAGDGLWLGTYPKWGDIEYRPKIIIGDNVGCSRYCHIGAIGSIEIKDNVLFGSNVLINDHSHGKSEVCDVPRKDMPLVSKGGILIGKNVWVGDNVCILAGVTIGDNCIIGANSVVTKSIPENCVAVGNPAKVVKNMENSERSV